MSSKYLEELARMHKVAGGVDGIYTDPQDDNFRIVKNGSSIMRLPKSFFETKITVSKVEDENS